MSARMLRLGPSLALACSLAAACAPNPGREQRDFERMRVQQRYDLYQSSDAFANGAVMQPPPAHTIARDVDPGADHASGAALVALHSGRVDSAYVATSPLVVDAALLAAGARQFAISCAPCHGAAGFGGGTVAANMTEMRPPSLRSARVASQPDGELFDKITNGYGRMPPYGWQIPARLRWAVIAYVRALGSTPMTAAARTDSSAAAYFHFVDSLHAAGKGVATLFPSAGVPR